MENSGWKKSPPPFFSEKTLSDFPRAGCLMGE
jgi:hypothetical protein